MNHRLTAAVLLLTVAARIPAKAESPEDLKSSNPSFSFSRRGEAAPFATVRGAPASSAAGLSPLPEDASLDWRAAKREGEAAFDAILAKFIGSDDHDSREVRRILAQVRGLVAKVDADVRRDAQRKIEFFRVHTVDGVSFEELRSRVEFVAQTRLFFAYGWLMPQPVNEGFAEAARSLGIPGYPLKVFITDRQFCERYAPYGEELARVIRSIKPDFFPKSDAPNLCDGPLSGEPSKKTP
jgi:hypothetical protein